MPNPPIQGLLSAPPPSPSKPLPPGYPPSGPNLLDQGIQGTLGFLGIGGDDSSANRGGALIGAGLPLTGLIGKVGGLLRGASSTAPEAVQGLSRATSGFEAIPGASLSSQDILNPHTAGVMQRMYDAASPTFQAMEKSGAFSGDRSVGSLRPLGEVPTLGETSPEFTAPFQDAAFNSLKGAFDPHSDPVERAYRAIMAKGGR